MIRRDITDQWEILKGSTDALHDYIMDVYGAERTQIAPFPHAALIAADGQLLGFAQTVGYPRITEADGRVLLDLSDLFVSLGTARADMRESIAALAHTQWSGWMAYMFAKSPINDDGTWTMPAWAVERWQRQMTTAYADLSEEEKASDRVEADRVLSLFYEDAQ